ncbi:MAG: hypothetical protein CFH38_00618, partial [Alphaproteobacteria bacterium MarineAlpha10_Bin1]
MVDETSQEEPSMEEILASIRRIISEDGEEEGAPAAEAGAEAATEDAAGANADAIEETAEAPMADAAGDEVLELTEEVDAQGNVVSDEIAETPAPEPEPAIDAGEPAREVIPDSAPATMADATADEPASPLMETVTEGAAAGAFAALATQVGPGQADRNAQQVTPGGRTIEDHVLEMLRPMLREWLDKHLPQ